MDNSLRLKLSKPFGSVYNANDAISKLRAVKSLLICVGDTSSLFIIKNKINANIFVYDKICKRKPIKQKDVDKIINHCNQNHLHTICVKNPASTITNNLKLAINLCIKNKSGAICVEGEEDLASLVAFCYAPLGSVVVYGQPNKGLVIVNVSAKKRSESKKLLKKIKQN